MKDTRKALGSKGEDLAVQYLKKKGFKVIGAWSNEKENRFTWILAYDGPESFEKADKAYYDSPERKFLGQEPRRLLTEVDTVIMAAVSPT